MRPKLATGRSLIQASLLDCANDRRGPRSVFFFQAEDGIRYYKVTGVHVCSSDLSDADCRLQPLAGLLTVSVALPPCRVEMVVAPATGALTVRGCEAGPAPLLDCAATLQL